MLKTSILPIVVNGNTKLHTVTQSYYLTRLIEAVKTLPPLEFIPTSAFTDFDNVLEEAGSEKHEQLLPGMQLKNLPTCLIHVMVSQIYSKLFFQDVCYYTGETLKQSTL